VIKKFVVMAFVLWSGIFVLNPLESFAECEVHFGSDSHPYCYILNLVKSGVPCQLKFSSNETNEEQLQTLKLCKAVSVLNDEGKCPDTEKDSSGDFCNNIQKGIAGEVCISEIKKDKKRSDIFSASSLCDYGTYLKGVLGSRDCRTSQDQLPLKLGSSNIETIVDRINESNHSVKLDELESALIPTLEKLLKKDKDWTLTGKESLKSSLQALVDKIESEKEGWIAKVRKTGKTAKFKHDLTFESGKTPITIRVYQDGSILLDMPEVKVGKGTFKEVNLGVHYQGPSHQKAHILVARSRAVIKKSNSDDDVKKAIAEYRIQSKLGRSNSGIIKPMFKATLKKRKSEDKVLSLVAPFYEKGDLSQFGKIMNGTNSTEKQNVDEDRIKVSIQLLDQLRFMHEKGIYHRDIKAGNILVRDGEAG
jgi:serine/threonine protein kinase